LAILWAVFSALLSGGIPGVIFNRGLLGIFIFIFLIFLFLVFLSRKKNSW
jgi:hypothetical protein